MIQNCSRHHSNINAKRRKLHCNSRFY
uniref:Uncharacterized protein n=1 Tax=Arundo donax TaxID=35708 RepID=A0A0A9H249_ARUDO